MRIEIPAWVDGVLTPVEKLEAHQRGLKHKAVSVFVRRGEEILLQRRALEKYHTPGLWANTCCTHPAWNEDPLDCANRRLEEELGITGQKPEFRQRVEYRAAVGNGLVEHEVVDLYLVEAEPDMPLAPNPAEVMDVAWERMDSLFEATLRDPHRFTPWLRIYLAEHAEAIFGPVAAPAE